MSDDWLDELERRLVEFLDLGRGWDGYDAKPIADSAVHEALDFLYRTASVHISPTVRGGVQLEYDGPAWSLEIEILPGCIIEGLYADRDHKHEFTLNWGER